MQYEAPDGEYRVYSRRLINFLIASDCKPIRQHQNGDATFHRTGTLKNLIDEFMQQKRPRSKAQSR
jgi:hypothetical protein